MAAIEKVVCYSYRSQEKGLCQVIWGSTQVDQRTEGVRENVAKSLYCSFCEEGRVSRLRTG
jgi:hypothetical protein